MPEDEPQACGHDGGRRPDESPGQARTGEQAWPGGQAWPGERFSHEALAVILQVRRNSLHVLLWQRGAPPFQGLWALPGGPLGAQERLGTSVGRHLATKVDLTDIAYLEQLETRSDPGRDPRGRVLATAYLALISADVEPRIPADTAWHRVGDLPPTAFDHGSIAESGRDRLRAKLSYTNIGFALTPESFTIAQLRDIYAASLGHPVSATNLQRVLTRRGVIEATPAAARPTSLGGRPATLYRFATRTLIITNPFAAFRPPSPAADIGLVKATGQTASVTKTSTAPTCLAGAARPSARRLRPPAGAEVASRNRASGPFTGRRDRRWPRGAPAGRRPGARPTTRDGSTGARRAPR